MHTDQPENSLLNRIRSGYDAGVHLRTNLYANKSIQDFREALCNRLKIRYYQTLCDNAFEATLHYISKTGKPVTVLDVEQKFKQNFEEQALIYCHRKQLPEYQTATSNELDKLLNSITQTIVRDLTWRFKHFSDDDDKDCVQEAIRITLERLNDSSFKLTSSLELFVRETARHLAYQELDKQNRLLSSNGRSGEGTNTNEPGKLFDAYEQFFQRLGFAGQQYITEKSTADCRAFLDVYWQLESPFDFIDPGTQQPLRDEMVKERLGLTEDELSRLKTDGLKLNQQQALQLISGKQKRKQDVNEFYQKCIAGLLHYVSEHADVFMPAEKIKKTPGFLKKLVEWMRLTRKNPTTIY